MRNRKKNGHFVIQLTLIIMQWIRLWPLFLWLASFITLLKLVLRELWLWIIEKKDMCRFARGISYQTHFEIMHKSLVLLCFVTCGTTSLFERNKEKKHKRQICTTEPNIKDVNLCHSIVELLINSKAILKSVTFTKYNNEHGYVSDATIARILL